MLKCCMFACLDARPMLTAKMVGACRDIVVIILGVRGIAVQLCLGI